MRGPTNQQSDCPYSVHFERFKEVGDHLEYELRVDHTSGASWREWVRFSAFDSLHTTLALEFGEDALPAAPKKSWVPKFLQVFDNDMCAQRMTDLQRYLDAALRDPRLARHEAIHKILGTKPPEPPDGFRVARRSEMSHELEIRPSTDVRRSPVDGYKIEMLHESDAEPHVVNHPVAASGAQVQKARIGRLIAGKYTFTVTAWNFAGEASPISVDVNVDAPNPEARSLSKSGCAQGDRRATMPSRMSLGANRVRPAVAEPGGWASNLPSEAMQQRRHSENPLHVRDAMLGAQQLSSHGCETQLERRPSQTGIGIQADRRPSPLGAASRQERKPSIGSGGQQEQRSGIHIPSQVAGIQGDRRPSLGGSDAHQEQRPGMHDAGGHSEGKPSVPRSGSRSEIHHEQQPSVHDSAGQFVRRISASAVGSQQDQTARNEASGRAVDIEISREEQPSLRGPVDQVPPGRWPFAGHTARSSAPAGDISSTSQESRRQPVAVDVEVIGARQVHRGQPINAHIYPAGRQGADLGIARGSPSAMPGMLATSSPSVTSGTPAGTLRGSTPHRSPYASIVAAANPVSSTGLAQPPGIGYSSTSGASTPLSQRPAFVAQPSGADSSSTSGPGASMSQRASTLLGRPWPNPTAPAGMRWSPNASSTGQPSVSSALAPSVLTSAYGQANSSISTAQPESRPLVRQSSPLLRPYRPSDVSSAVVPPARESGLAPTVVNDGDEEAKTAEQDESKPSSRKPSKSEPQTDEQDEDDRLCIVCMDSEKTHAFVPCGHRCVCKECGDTVVGGTDAACPICRGPAQCVMQIFT